MSESDAKTGNPDTLGENVSSGNDSDESAIPDTATPLDTVSPNAGNTDSFPWWILVIIGTGIVVAIVTILLIRRRNRKGDESTV
jgi:hypothetical protein